MSRTRCEKVELRTDAGLRLVGDRRGPNEGPPVVLLHGGGQTRHSWEETAETLAQVGFDAYAFDLRGHGESDWAPDGDYRVETFAEDLHAIGEWLGRKPAVVGASMGGLTAIACEGERYPGGLSALVLVDISTRIEEEGVQRILGFMQGHPDGFASVEEAAKAVAAYRPGRPRPRDLSGLRKNLRRQPDGRWRWHWDPEFLDDKVRAGGRDLPRLRAAARRLDLPTLLVRGRESDIVSPEGVEEFLGLVPHAEFVDVAEASHMVAGDRNDAFTEAVVSFLSRNLRCVRGEDGEEEAPAS